jgi:dTDP-4-dehydrorhamnose reductase
MKLIIGGSGFIGNNLYNNLSKKKEKVLGTYFNSKKPGLSYFDLENPNLNNLNINLSEVDYAFICSAISKIDECKKNEKKAYKINVDGTKRIIDQLIKNKIFPVFFSSDFVFDGKHGNYSEKDKKNPCTVYGNHKKIIEDFLNQSNEKFLILRISKIFGLEINDGTLLTTFLKQLKNNESINCAYDQIFNPTYISDLIGAINISLDKKISGLYNVTSNESFSRYELAVKIKNQLKIKSGQVVSCSIKDFNFLDSRSLNTSLDSSKFIDETGFNFYKMDNCISHLERFLL